MSHSLREERKVRTSDAIAAAALELFATRGYARVTVAEVAAAARVGERTLYRYFVDKEDLLFGEDQAFRSALQTAIERQPTDASPLTVLRGASAAVAHLLENRREPVRRRARVIASAPALVARERAKHSASEAILAEELRGRGIPANQGRLLARLTIACFDEAMNRWLAHEEPHPTLSAELDAVFTELTALTGNAGPLRRGTTIGSEGASS